MPNGRKIFQMVKNMPSETYPILGGGVENKPSGIPAGINGFILI
jgi:hypothetical protein